MKRISYRKLMWVALILLLLLVPACNAQEGRLTEVAICSSLPLAGGSNARAVSMSNAIEMALAEQGEVTLNGQRYPLRYVPLDDTGPSGSWDTAQEAANARAAIADHDCLVYIGTYNSGAAKIAIPILNAVQMPMISPGNTYPGLTKPGTGIGDEPWIYYPLGPELRNYCRVVPTDELQTPAAARFAAQLGVTRVGIFHDTELYGEGLAQLFAADAVANGMTVVSGPIGINWRRILEGGSLGSQEARQAAETLLEGDPELVYFGGTTSHGPMAIYNELLDRGYTGYFMGADGIAERGFVSELSDGGQRSAGIYATLVGTPLDELPTAGQTWRERYGQRYGAQPDAFAAPSYEAALVTLRAIEAAQIAEGEGTLIERARPAVLAAMRQTANFDGILGPWSFDANCDTTSSTISINQVQGDDFVLIDTVSGE
ncbi:MAG: branched-chain amino acid ABC transporter substrate-binding protein [Anaerolineales bacterium]|nr:branched-chain amino acid ABC transporter substrate-binding protein [Anaerolineales bacterium]MCB9129063.1 branched-chain amino acid ABC transporter substrate-binding protein [Ardenticatenales bacterium]